MRAGPEVDLHPRPRRRGKIKIKPDPRPRDRGGVHREMRGSEGGDREVLDGCVRQKVPRASTGVALKL
jgi:hypothetical protein